jgi:hypothetical protein
LVYHYSPGAGAFELSSSVPVGDDPVSVTVAQGADALTRGGVPDLLVANRGSNDVSVLIGSVTDGVWTATPYQRLNSGGQGPVGVAVLPTGGVNGPELMVTNSDGAVVTIPGIGSGGTGSGFFQGTNEATISLPPLAPVPPIVIGTTVIAVGQNGDLLTINGGVVTATALGSAVLTLAGGGGLPLFAGLANDTIVGLDLNPDGELVLNALAFDTAGDPSALEVQEFNGVTEVFYTVSDSTLPFFHAFGPAVPSLTPVENMGNLLPLANQPLAFVVALGPVLALETTMLTETSPAVFGEEPQLGRLDARPANGGGDEGGEAQEAQAPMEPEVRGVQEALEQWFRGSSPQEDMESTRQLLNALFGRWSQWWRSMPAPSGTDKAPGPVSAEPAAPEQADISVKFAVPSGPMQPAAVSADSVDAPADERPEPVPEGALARLAAPQDLSISGLTASNILSSGARVSDLALASFVGAEVGLPWNEDYGWMVGSEHYRAAVLPGLIVWQAALTAASRCDRERRKRLAL